MIRSSIARCGYAVGKSELSSAFRCHRSHCITTAAVVGCVRLIMVAWLSAHVHARICW